MRIWLRLALLCSATGLILGTTAASEVKAESPAHVSGWLPGSTETKALRSQPVLAQFETGTARSRGDRQVRLTLEIQTVPPLEGVHFLLDGQRFESHEKGIARIVVWREGRHYLEALPSESSTPERALEFARWGDDVFMSQREFVIASSTSLEAGFNVHYPVELSFIDQDGELVPPERVETVVLRNSIGDVHTFPGDGQEWLQAGHVLRRDIKLEEVEIVYSVQQVMVDGSNVVNRGQQRFVVSPEQEPQVELLLYSAQFTARDALFGFPLGWGIRLEYPDGKHESFPFEGNEVLRLNSLARGTYGATVVGALGFAPPSIFVLSRDQEVNAIVISVLDIVVVILLSTSVLVGLLVARRPGLLAGIRGRLARGQDPA